AASEIASLDCPVRTYSSMILWLEAPIPSMSQSVLFSTHVRRSTVMSLTTRETLRKARTLNVFSPLMSIMSAMVEKRAETSALSDMEQRIIRHEATNQGSSICLGVIVREMGSLVASAEGNGSIKNFREQPAAAAR